MIEATDEMEEAFDDAAYPLGLSKPDVKLGLAAAFALIERDYHVQRRLPPLDLTPPDPCPFCSTGLAGYCPWHTDARDIP